MEEGQTSNCGELGKRYPIWNFQIVSSGFMSLATVLDLLAAVLLTIEVNWVGSHLSPLLAWFAFLKSASPFMFFQLLKLCSACFLSCSSCGFISHPYVSRHFVLFASCPVFSFLVGFLFPVVYFGGYLNNSFDKLTYLATLCSNRFLLKKISDISPWGSQHSVLSCSFTKSYTATYFQKATYIPSFAYLDYLLR